MLYKPNIPQDILRATKRSLLAAGHLLREALISNYENS
jgi:hypothetical protein